MPKRCTTSDALRLFVAVEVCQAVVERSQQLVARLAATDTAVRWVKPGNMHVTLKFGEAVPKAKLESVFQVVHQTSARHAKFLLRFAGIGAFPSIHRPLTVWLGIDDPSGGLLALHKELQRGLARLGFPKERRGFHPHVTLGRMRTTDRAAMQAEADLLRLESAYEAGEQTVEELVVFSSALSPAGPVYTALDSASLKSD